MTGLMRPDVVVRPPASPDEVAAVLAVVRRRPAAPEPYARWRATRLAAVVPGGIR